MEHTFAMIKPDAFDRADDIFKLIEKAGFNIAEKSTLELSVDRAKAFYEEHKDRPFFDGLVEFMTSGKVIAMILQKENAINSWRALLGPTNAKQAKEEDPESIRGRFGTDVQRNAAHGSDSTASATREIKFFFSGFELPANDDLSAGDESKAYLMMNVVPVLTAGLTEMCKISPRPSDPLEWLCQYFRSNNPASAQRPKVYFVLGGPGAGKGTQCAKIVEEFGFDHFSAGDLLRAEVKSGSEQGVMIDNMIKEGKIVPGEVTIGLLRNAIQSSSKKGILIDGFPRKLDQAGSFEHTVSAFEFVLFFDCPEEVMEERLLKRGETSGRTDDNAESIRKRFKTFVETSMPVIEYYEAKGKVRRINATKSPDEIYSEVRSVFL
eukprot:Plantae.Rhodophyta-Purpureofilum_apyrenoidigerum.ctg4454.p1 GENE.Plantae.Rhodophyta-Purpureofilum_apyrenoidigerum.ctg4454~~Plantae.Rhodophyta-Purpureofilum_apyrenoidigerum.ctg4454.p1  ORF type:complete len:379 (-),score=77.86 Plantae.Rhodophyta-Purpureofilum_apyrenoidigerum.ctg4454:1601-2737(-)